MKAAFVLLLIALSILPAILVVKAKMGRPPKE